MNTRSDSYVEHYGTPWDGVLNSGRYIYGSGENPYQRSLSFKGMVNQLREKGMSNTEIAKAMGMSTTQFRAMTSITKDEIHKHQINEIQKLKKKGYSDAAIADKLGLSGESQVRSLMKQSEAGRVDKTKEIADILKKQVDDKKYLDIGSGTENRLGISQDKLKVAVAMLEEQGYKKQNIYVNNSSNSNNKTTVKVLTKDDVTMKELYENRDLVQPVNGVYTEDSGRTIRNIEPPVSIDSNRVKIRYNEEGGVKKDGVIELRRGVDDLNLHDAHYAQVRIAVDGTHYLKGMAMYGEDSEFPKGVDIIFNTNKHVGTDKMDVLKEMKKDKDGNIAVDNPFGATIKNEENLVRAQQHYTGKDGKQHLSALNIVNEEGDWGHWKKTIASQMLSKQPVNTAKKQLQIASDRSRLELQEIMALDNPVVKKKLLDSFAKNADAAAVELKGAKFPRQASQVILPINSLKPTEIFAPNYKDGEQVVCVRYPYGGKFEMPVLTVNNRNKEGRSLISTKAVDAVGINYKVAEQLSGADFDGDTVLVIPTKGQNIKTSKPIQELIDFEPKESYKAYEGMPKVSVKTGFNKQKQMGMVSNLITDMTIKGADMSEITRAVKHSMVVIDAEKHNLNWRQSEKDFGIDELKKKYQTKTNPDTGKTSSGGASTLISRAKGEKRVNERKDYTKIDPRTGELIYQETGRTYEKVKTTVDPVTGKKTYTPTGKIMRYQTVTTQLADAKDAFSLSSGSPIEKVYAEYSNEMKAQANEARKALVAIKTPTRDPEARIKYAKEVSSLEAKLNIAKSNSPLERQAQLITSKVVEMAKKDNPDITKDDLKKIRGQAIKGARHRTGADKHQVEITPSEWEAIQNNAISASELDSILDNADMDAIRKLATPRENKQITNAKIARIKALSSREYTNEEIAEDLGISVSTVQKYLD